VAPASEKAKTDHSSLLYCLISHLGIKTSADAIISTAALLPILYIESCESGVYFIFVLL